MARLRRFIKSNARIIRKPTGRPNSGNAETTGHAPMPNCCRVTPANVPMITARKHRSDAPMMPAIM